MNNVSSLLPTSICSLNLSPIQNLMEALPMPHRMYSIIHLSKIICLSATSLWSKLWNSLWYGYNLGKDDMEAHALYIYPLWSTASSSQSLIPHCYKAKPAGAPIKQELINILPEIWLSLTFTQIITPEKTSGKSLVLNSCWNNVEVFIRRC